MNRLLLGLFLLTICPLTAQIVDDSTQLIYGPSTTHLFYAEDLLTLRKATRPLDTLLRTVSRQDLPHRRPLAQTHLGTIGTAILPLVEEFPSTVHMSIGRTAYLPYYTPASALPHFDSQSPYLQVNVLLGQRRRSFLDIDLTRNITPRANFAIGMHRRTADVPIGPSLSRGALGVNSGQYHAQASYFSSDSSYAILAAFSTLSHKVIETGGSLIAPDAPDGQRFNYTQSEQALSNTSTKTNYFTATILQRLRLSSSWHAYLQSTWKQSRFTFDEFLNVADRAFYTNFSTNSGSSSVSTQLLGLVFQEGLIHHVGASTHRLYVQQYLYQYNHYMPTVQSTAFYTHQAIEVSPGYLLTHHFSSRYFLRLLATFRLQDPIKSGQLRAYYLFKLRLTTPYLGAEVEATAHEKGLQYYYHFGNHFAWSSTGFTDNSLGGAAQAIPRHPLGHRLRGALYRTFAYGNLVTVALTPRLGLSWRITDVLFNAERRPTRIGQTGLGLAGIKLSVGLFKQHVKVIGHWLSQLPMGKDQHVWALPPHQAFMTLEFSDIWFNELGVRAEVWGHWRAPYFPNAFEPELQQFYWQDFFEVRSYLTLNAAITIQLSKFTGYLRLLHFNQGQGRSYFTVPYYLGGMRSLDFGFRWQFFE